MKAITFITAFLGIFLFQGCDELMDALIDALFEKDELEIWAKGERLVSGYNTYSLDSSQYSVNVGFTGMTDADKTHYHPLVVIYTGGWSKLGSFSGAQEINGEHGGHYSTTSTEIIVYAELRQESLTTYYDTAFIKLTGIYVY